MKYFLIILLSGGHPADLNVDFNLYYETQSLYQCESGGKEALRIVKNLVPYDKVEFKCEEIK